MLSNLVREITIVAVNSAAENLCQLYLSKESEDT